MGKQVKCAGKCGKTMDKVDGHASGWRPLCDACRDKSWWFDEYCPGNETQRAVRVPNENFGKNPYA